MRNSCSRHRLPAPVFVIDDPQLMPVKSKHIWEQAPDMLVPPGLLLKHGCCHTPIAASGAPSGPKMKFCSSCFSSQRLRLTSLSDDF